MAAEGGRQTVGAGCQLDRHRGVRKNNWPQTGLQKQCRAGRVEKEKEELDLFLPGPIRLLAPQAQKGQTLERGGQRRQTEEITRRNFLPARAVQPENEGQTHRKALQARAQTERGSRVGETECGSWPVIVHGTGHNKGGRTEGD
uniref:(northern house mosquito) hypothetical protein n=1 Tax=Culex pipiens TaxID=7175 RepID=A0A8D8EW38_CULPI